MKNPEWSEVSSRSASAGPTPIMLARLGNELQKQLQGPASSAGVGVSVESVSTRKQWLIPPRSNGKSPDSFPTHKTKRGTGRRVRRVSLPAGYFSGCKLTFAFDEAPVALVDCMQQLAIAVAQKLDVERREEVLLEELAGSWESLGTLYETSHDLQCRLGLSNITNRLLDRVVASEPDISAILWILEQDRFHQFTLRRCGVQKPRSEGLLGLARSVEMPILIEDSRHDPRVTAHDVELADAGPVIVIPVRTRQGLEGALEVWRPAGEEPFNTYRTRLLEAIALQAITAIENERLHKFAIEGERVSKEMEIGSNIQQRLLLGRCPNDLKNVSIANRMLPARQVGGDFYEFIRHSPTCFDIIVGDGMGKGIPAALIAAATKVAIVRATAEAKSAGDVAPEPAAIVTAVNQDLSSQLITLNGFVTLFYGRMDLLQNKLTYVDAGHSQAMHYSAARQSTQVLSGNCFPLGFSKTERYTQSEVALQPQDILIVYTDGLSQAMNSQGEMYGEQRLSELLTVTPHQSPEQIAQRVPLAVKKFTGQEDLEDDLTCVVVKIGDPELPGNHHEGCSLSIQASFRELGHVREWLEQTIDSLSFSDGDSPDTSSMQLVVQEAVVNAIMHGLHEDATKALDISIVPEQAALTVQIAYRGAPFDPAEALPPSFDGSREHGFGLFIMQELMDQVEHGQLEDGRAFIRLTKLLNKSAGAQHHD